MTQVCEVCGERQAVLRVTARLAGGDTLDGLVCWPCGVDMARGVDGVKLDVIVDDPPVS